MHRKRTLLNLLIAFLVFTSVACTCALPGLSSGPSIVGTWQGTYDGTNLNFTFESSGNFVFLMDGVEAGRGQYAVDYATHPATLDLHYSDGMDVYSIIQFLDSNTVWMENVGPGDPRPTVFSDYAILTRVSP